MKEQILSLIAGGKISSAAARLANNIDKLNTKDFKELDKKIKMFQIQKGGGEKASAFFVTPTYRSARDR